MKKGFYTALGTPVDDDGRIADASLTEQIERQLSAGASGLLLMGSMGMEVCVRGGEYARAVRVAAQAVKGRCPLFVGAMDNSLARIRDRIESIRDLPVDGAVVTTPYYYMSDAQVLRNFFSKAADMSPFPVYLYDLPVCTKMKITFDLVKGLSKHPNIRGIKSGDLLLAKQIRGSDEVAPDFSFLFSNIDLFDVANAYGIGSNLDGMFSCTPRNARQMYGALARGNLAGATAYLSKILSLRDAMATNSLFPCFTAAMNLLGMEGTFHPDYMGRPTETAVAAMREKLTEIGEL